MRRMMICLLAIVLVLTSSGMLASAAQPDRTYTYEDNLPVPSTNAYQVKKVVDEAVMGTTRMKDPRDIFVDADDNIYILDSGNCRVLVLDKTYKCIKELKEFKYEEETLTLAEGAQGLFYREANQRLYIADTENDRIIVTDLDGNVSKVFTKPVDELLDEKVAYKPKKIIVDNMGIMYVVSGNINTGAMLVDGANNFLGFYGTNKLKMTAAMQMEYFWRSIMTAAMNQQSEVSFQPVEFNNLFWSEDRFVYTVSPLVESVASPISKLNALGNNVFPQDIDLYTLTTNRKITNMVIMDITVDNEGAITIVDNTTGRLYQYDEGCNLLAVFGGIGYQEGLFQMPVSIETDSDNSLLVLDAGKNSITVMEQTFYGQMIRSANYLYNEGKYQESIEPWMEVLRMNANYTQAYKGLGKAYISLGEYEKAMEYFQLGKDPEGYGEAKAALRDEKVRENFGLVAAVVIIVLFAALFYEKIGNVISDIVWRIRRNKREK
ncbi:MAG: hypothetical protein J6V25_08505 [Oscillospiraceae bacterium]|nr:hypothetical protein [Oscillospiraceae bacterium]